MSIKPYKVKGKTLWKVNKRILCADGIRRPFRKQGIPTKALATALVEQAIRDGWEGYYLPGHQQGKLRVSDIWEMFEPHAKKTKKSWNTDVGRAAHLLRNLGSHKAARLTLRDIEKYRENRSTEKTVRGGPPAESTVNREVALLRRMLNYAVTDCRALRVNPIQNVPMVEENNLRSVIITPSDFEKLYDAAEEPLKPILLVAFTTGMRKSSILHLRRSQLDLSGDRGRIYLEPEDVKKNSGVPVIVLTKRTTEVLRDLPVSTSGYVFVNPETNAPWSDLKTLYPRAREKAGLPENVWFHDTRAAFVVNARRAGVDDKTIMSMTGHKTLAAYDRYNRVDDSDQERAVRKIEAAAVAAVLQAEADAEAENLSTTGKKTVKNSNVS